MAAQCEHASATGAEARLRVASKARLRFDTHSSKWLLLYPERGLELSESASDILRLCDGERTSREIVAELSERYRETTGEEVERDVLTFLAMMRERGLVEEVP